VHKLNAKYLYIVKVSYVDIWHNICEITRFLDFIHVLVLKKGEGERHECVSPTQLGYDDFFSITENTCVGYYFFL
jgi:hypothetical protein